MKKAESKRRVVRTQKSESQVTAVSVEAKNQLSSLNLTPQDSEIFQLIAAHASIAQIQKLIGEAGHLLISRTEKYERSPLVVAASAKRYDICHALLDYSPPLHVRELNAMLQGGHECEDVAMRMMKMGVSVNGSVNPYIISPFMTAVVNCSPAMVRALVAHGSDPHVEDSCYGNAAIKAAYRGDVEIMSTLVDLRVDVQGTRMYRGIPGRKELDCLSIAKSKKGNQDLVKYLEENFVWK